MQSNLPYVTPTKSKPGNPTPAKPETQNPRLPRNTTIRQSAAAFAASTRRRRRRRRHTVAATIATNPPSVEGAPPAPQPPLHMRSPSPVAGTGASARLVSTILDRSAWMVKSL